MNYPQSKRGFQCLGPCNEPNTVTIHPISLKYVTAKVPYCAVTEHTIGENLNIVDECTPEDNNVSQFQFKTFFTIPYIEFNPQLFLNTNYQIKTIDDALVWFEQNIHAPFDTINRIMDCVMQVFSKKINIIDPRMANAFKILIKGKYIPTIYKNIHKYIDFSSGKIVITSPSKNHLSKDEHRVDRINYIVDTYITDDVIYNFLMMFFNQKPPTMDNAINKFIGYIIEKIKTHID